MKPSNVLLAADGPRVIDFGIARAVDGNRMTQTGVVVGSPGYMPPEQALGQQVGTAGDVFSLGAVLAYAATGRSTFGEAASQAAMMYQVVHGEPDLTGMPASLVDLVRACLAKDPAARPAPAQIERALAPQGAASLLADWLPSAVASTIATHASRILDLESEPVGAVPAQPSYSAYPGQPAHPATVLDAQRQHGGPSGPGSRLRRTRCLWAARAAPPRSPSPPDVASSASRPAVSRAWPWPVRAPPGG